MTVRTLLFLILLISVGGSIKTVPGQSSTFDSPTAPSQASPTPSPRALSGTSTELLRPELITAIGTLWPLALILLLLTLAVIVNKPLRGIATHIFHKFETADNIELKGWPPGIAFSRIAKSEGVSNTIEGSSVGPESTDSGEQQMSGSAISHSSLQDEKRYAAKSPDDWAAELDKALEARDSVRADEIYRNMQEAESNAEQRLKNELFYLYVKFQFGDGDSLKALEGFVQKPEAEELAHRAIGLCYEFANQPSLAVKEFEHAIAKARDEDNKTIDTTYLANCLFALGNEEEAETRILAQIEQSTKANNISALYSTLASGYERQKKRELQALALEKALEHDPSNKGVLFDMAYAYGEIPLHGLSLLHYKGRLRFEPNDSSSLNNIGVAFNNVEMPIEAVKAYKAAAERKNTLASANLANKYLSEGFAVEAQEVLQAALQSEGVHKNVGTSLARLRGEQDTEGKKEREILDSAIQQQCFLRSYAQAYFFPKAGLTLAGEWKFTDGTTLSIVQTDQRIISEWLISGKKKKIEGEVLRQSAKISRYEMTYYLGDKELMYSFDSAGYAYLSQDGNTLNMMTIKKNQHSFITLTRTSENAV